MATVCVCVILHLALYALMHNLQGCIVLSSNLCPFPQGGLNTQQANNFWFFIPQHIVGSIGICYAFTFTFTIVLLYCSKLNYQWHATSQLQVKHSTAQPQQLYAANAFISHQRQLKHSLPRQQLPTLQPDWVVQSPLRTTPKDPSPNFPNKHRSFSLIRHVRLGFKLSLSNADFINAAAVGCSAVLRFSREEDDPSDIYTLRWNRYCITKQHYLRQTAKKFNIHNTHIHISGVESKANGKYQQHWSWSKSSIMAWHNG